MSSRTAARLAWSAGALTLALIFCSVGLAVLNRSDPGGVIFLITGVASSAVVGGVVASRRPANPVGWFFVGSALSLALQEFTVQYATYGLLTEPGSLPLAQAMAWPQTWLWVPGTMLLFSFLPLYFPNGRLISRRWRWVVRLAVFSSIATATNDALLPGEVKDSGFVNPLGIEALRPVLGPLDTGTFVLYMVTLFASAASLVVRFRRSRGEERQQLKWFTYAVSAIPVWFFLISWPVEEVVSPVLFGVMDSLLIAGVPVAVCIAVLRYRLYDIDRIINRTLVYGLLTMALALVYLGSVVVLQRIFVALTGQGSQLAIVASTLAIAALFGPLRRRVQGFIDRRFYRKKYDAEKTLQAFNARLRDEIELDALTDDLTEVVQETMQPTHVSLWLREPERDGRAMKGGKEP